MIKCIHDKCCWPECDKTCGLVPTGDYVAGSSEYEPLIKHLIEETTNLKTQLDSVNFWVSAALKDITHFRLNLENAQSESDTNDYVPTCPHGYYDCVYDPAYIRKYYPNWWKDLGMPTSCKNCPDGERYDDEDK